jgi:hypothetical protein
MSTDKMPKNAKKFYCEKCDFRCSKKSNYENHLTTAKHQNRTILNDLMPKNAEYVCECGKMYKARNSLWYHKKKCKLLKPESTVEDESLQPPSKNYDSIINEFTSIITKQQETIDALIPKVGNTSITNNTSNINVNVFLNEQCKDAMNLTDFIDSIQLSIEDVTNISENGQTSGFANILIDKLTSLDLYKRPLHCSDAKRETLYVKNNNTWNKEADDRPQIKEAIDHISRKGIQRVPDLNMSDEQISDTIFEIVKTPVNHKKIISKVAKEIKI